jgi:hypothetical protein
VSFRESLVLRLILSLVLVQQHHRGLSRRLQRFDFQHGLSVSSLLEECKTQTVVALCQIAILNEFEEKLVGLETTMLPIHKHTQDLAIAQKSEHLLACFALLTALLPDIDAALAETDKLIHHTNVASEADESVNQRSITSDYKGYLEWTESVHAAIVYFQNNSQFKNSDKLLKKLVRLHRHHLLTDWFCSASQRDLNRKAVSDCEAEFERSTSSSSKPTDLTKVSWPFPPTYGAVSGDGCVERPTLGGAELIPSSTVSRLARIAQRMQISGSVRQIVRASSLCWLTQLASRLRTWRSCKRSEARP